MFELRHTRSKSYVSAGRDSGVVFGYPLSETIIVAQGIQKPLVHWPTGKLRKGCTCHRTLLYLYAVSDSGIFLKYCLPFSYLFCLLEFIRVYPTPR